MKLEFVAIGTSLGGLKALQKILSHIPPEFQAPVAIVQHRSKASDEIMVRLLQQYSAVPVVEVDDKQPVRPGHVYLAPPDYHLLVDRGRFSLSTDAPVSYARPSIDVLFESAADSYGAGLLAMVLTGANDDGARGAARVKAQRGLLFVQEPREADSGVMPAAAIAAAAADFVAPLDELAQKMVEIGRGSAARQQSSH